MNARIHVITLAVADLERALAFYRNGLGLETDGVIGTEFAGSDVEPAGAVVMFHLEGGLILALYPRTELAKDASIRSETRRRASSASATRSRAERLSTNCSHEPRRAARP